MNVKVFVQGVFALALCAVIPLASVAYAQDEGLERIKRFGLWPKHVMDLANEGRFRDAQIFLQRLIHQMESDDSPNLVSLAGALVCLSDACLQLGEAEEAERTAQRALAVARQTSDSMAIGAALQSLGNAHDELGRFAEAEHEVRQSLDIFQRLQAPDSVLIADALGNLASVLVHTGRFLDAEPLLKRVAAIRYRKLGPGHIYVADSYFSLATTFERQDRWKDAEPYLRAALKVYQAGAGQNERLLMTLTHLVLVSRELQRWEDAISFYQRLMASAEKQYGPTDPRTIELQTLLGAIHFARGHYADAAEVYERALKGGEQAIGDYSAGLLRGQLARTYIKLGHYAESEELASRMLAGIQRREANEAAVYEAHSVRAEARYMQKKVEVAIDDLRVAVRLADQFRSNLAGSEHQRAHSFAASFRDDYVLLTRALIECGNMAEGLAVAERGRARTLIDQMQTAQADLLAGLEPRQAQTLRQALYGAEAKLKQIERRLAAIDADADLSDRERHARRRQLESDLGAARRELVEAHADVRNASPAYRQALSRDFQPAKLERIDQWLAEHHFQLQYYTIDDRAAFVLSRGPRTSDAAHFLEVSSDEANLLGIPPGPLTSETLAAVLHGPSGVLAALSTPEINPSVKQRLATLWQILVPAADREALLSRDCRGLVVVPDGPLTSLPFETLVVELQATPTYLLDVGPPVLYAPSATVLLNLAERPIDAASMPAKQPVLSVANPAYGESLASNRRPAESPTRGLYHSAGGGLADLQFSGTESVWVAEAFKKQGLTAAALRRELATEYNVRGNVQGRKLLHFACHGLADQAFGNFFGCLAITPGAQAATNPADDGFLTLPEIYELNLKQCDLAILSACQTNYGPQQKGEGVWALSRGFLVAGARRVVASNWLVDDEAAASLVSAFCADLAKAEGRGETPDYAAALHRAKRWVRKQDKWSSPYYWGTFVLVGPN